MPPHCAVGGFISRRVGRCKPVSRLPQSSEAGYADIWQGKLVDDIFQNFCNRSWHPAGTRKSIQSPKTSKSVSIPSPGQSTKHTIQWLEPRQESTHCLLINGLDAYELLVMEVSTESELDELRTQTIRGLYNVFHLQFH